MKVVINKCFGGFGLSTKAIKRYHELINKDVYFYKQTKYEFHDGKDEYTLVDSDKDTIDSISTCVLTENFGKSFNEFTDEINEAYFSPYDLERTDPILVQVVEELGTEANGVFAQLSIVEIPDNIDWYIDDYDGVETIEEQHRSWR